MSSTGESFESRKYRKTRKSTRFFSNLLPTAAKYRLNCVTNVIEPAEFLSDASKIIEDKREFMFVGTFEQKYDSKQ